MKGYHLNRHALTKQNSRRENEVNTIVRPMHHIDASHQLENRITRDLNLGALARYIHFF
jgi:hypothetical protein